MAKNKMSVQQRKYFVERISKTINEQILNLRQQSASHVYDVSEQAYKKYLKAIGLDKTIKEYNKLKPTLDELGSKISAVFDEIKNTLDDPDLSWQIRQHQPSLYGNNHTVTDINRAFRWCCNETAKKNDKSLTITDDIKKLEDKRDRAIDILHGVDEFTGTLDAVNNMLKGTDVPKLGA
tara:strand:- start:178 stop:714 length:537 start_codon:yes stop_codon:yes gene_type:complete